MAVDIIAPGQNIWKQVHADDSRVIVDAADYYRAFHAAAVRAQEVHPALRAGSSIAG